MTPPARTPTLEEAAQPVLRIRVSNLPAPPEPPTPYPLPGLDRTGPDHPHPTPPSLHRDGQTVGVKVRRQTWERAGALGIDRSRIMREALERAVGEAEEGRDLLEAREREQQALRALEAARQARVAAEEAERLVARGERVEAAVFAFREAFEIYRAGTPRAGRSAWLSWVEGRRRDWPELRRRDPRDLLDLLLEVPEVSCRQG
jgi:hypothetical protein